MISVQQLSAALYGVWLLLKLDARAWDYFEKTPGGFARSFLPAFLLLPLHFAHGILIYDTERTSLTFAPYLVVQLLTDVLAWVSFPFVMLYVTRLLNREPRYFWHLVPYNWFQLPAGLVLLSIAVLADVDLLTTPVAGFITLFALTLFFTFATFIARIGLQISLASAIGVVMLDLMLTLITNQLISRI